MEIREMRNIIGFTLEEILIASPYQHQGIGSWLLNELEHKVSEKAHLYWNYWLLTMICMNITMEKLIIIRRQILFQEQSGCNKFRFEELIGRYKFNNHVGTLFRKGSNKKY